MTCECDLLYELDWLEHERRITYGISQVNPVGFTRARLVSLALTISTVNENRMVEIKASSTFGVAQSKIKFAAILIHSQIIGMLGHRIHIRMDDKV